MIPRTQRALRVSKYRAMAMLLLLSGCGYLPSWAGGEEKLEPKLEGTRLSVVPVVAELQPDVDAKTVPMNMPAVNANADWQQHTGNFTAQNSNLGLSGDLTRRISVSVGDGNEFVHMLVPRPVVAEGRVYGMDAKGEITAHEEADITRVIWRSKGVATEDGEDTVGGGLAFDQGVLYAVSGRGIIAAFDAATGAEKWRKALHAPLRSAPRIGAGKLFVVTLDNQVMVLNTADGDMLWTQRGITEAAGIMNSVSPTIAGDVVMVPYSSGEIYALSVADGKEIWSESLSSGKHTQASALLSGIGGDPVVDNSVVVSVSSGGMISVAAIMTGQKSWERPVGSLNTPWLAGDSLFVLSTNNTLVSFVKYDGRIRWSTQLPRFGNPDEKKEPITMKGPVLVDGKLAVVASTGQLYLISAETGEIVSTIEVPENIYTTPVVAGGQMLLLDQDATLYSIR